MLYITAVKPKHPQKGDEAIFYLRDSEKQKTIVLEEKVGHLFATYEMSPDKANDLTKRLNDSFPPITGGAYPKQRAQALGYSMQKDVVHFYGPKEDKEVLSEDFMRNLKKCYKPHTCYFPHEGAEKILQDLKKDEQLKHLDFELCKQKYGTLIQVLCEKKDLRKLPGDFKKYKVKGSKTFKRKEHAEEYKKTLREKRIKENTDHVSLGTIEYENKFHITATCTEYGLKLLGRKKEDAKIESYKAKGTRTDPQNLGSYQGMLNWRFPVFSKVELKDGRINFSKFTQFSQERISLEKVLSDKKCVIDIETQDYDTDHEKVFMVTFKTDEENIIYTLYDPGVKKLKGADIVVCNDEKDLIMRLAEKERSYDPLFVIGHNIQQFDRMKLKHFGKRYGKYQPGANMDEPRMRSSSTGKVETLSRFEIDTLYLKKTINYLENNRFETFAKRIGLDFEKIINYEQMAELIRKGDKKSIERVTEYTVNDGVFSQALGEWCLENILLKSYLFSKSPTDVCKTSDKNLSDQLRAMQYFIHLGTHRDRYNYHIGRKKEILDLDKLKFKFFDVFEGKTGRFDDVNMIYYPIFIEALEDIIDYNPDAKKIKEKAKKTDDKDLKFDLLHTLSAFLAEPVTDFKNYLEKFNRKLGERVDPYKFYDEGDGNNKSRADWILGKAYGSSESLGQGRSVNVITWNDSLCSRIEKINERIKEFGFINGRRMMMFERFDDPLAIDYGKGFLVSMPKQRYIGIFGDTPIMEGVNLKKRGVDKEQREEQAEFVKKFLFYLKDNDAEKAEKMLSCDLAKKLHDDLKNILRTAVSTVKGSFEVKSRQGELDFSKSKI